MYPATSQYNLTGEPQKQIPAPEIRADGSLADPLGLKRQVYQNPPPPQALSNPLAPGNKPGDSSP